MGMVPERTRALHNFSLPRLKWGRQKQLRCINLPHHRRLPPDLSMPSRDGGIEAVRERLMCDVRTEMDLMKLHILSGGGGVDGGDEVERAAEGRPWNFRTQRAVCEGLSGNGGGDGGGSRRGNVKIDDRKRNLSPAMAEIKSPTPEYDGGGSEGRRANFAVALTKREIEEDFMAIMGIRPARRPKKRPKYVQRELDTLFPGLWLSEITSDMYKVNENHGASKR